MHSKSTEQTLRWLDLYMRLVGGLVGLAGCAEQLSLNVRCSTFSFDACLVCRLLASKRAKVFARLIELSYQNFLTKLSMVECEVVSLEYIFPSAQDGMGNAPGTRTTLGPHFLAILFWRETLEHI